MECFTYSIIIATGVDSTDEFICCAGEAKEPFSQGFILHFAEDSPKVSSAQLPDMTTVPSVSSHGPPLPSPYPLFTPTSLLLGDSIIQRTPSLNTTTSSFPVAHLQRTPRVAAITSTHNQSCGSIYGNQQYLSSELTINGFIELLNLLNNCGKGCLFFWGFFVFLVESKH